MLLVAFVSILWPKKAIDIFGGHDAQAGCTIDMDSLLPRIPHGGYFPPNGTTRPVAHKQGSLQSSYFGATVISITMERGAYHVMTCGVVYYYCKGLASLGSRERA